MTDRRRLAEEPRATGRPRDVAGGAFADGPNGGSGRAGRRFGPIPITATGVLLLVALILSVGWFAFTITVRDPSQIPLLASGLVVLGIVFAAIALVGGRATWRSSVRGRDARAFGHAVVGGIAWLAAAGCFAGAVVLFLLKGG